MCLILFAYQHHPNYPLIIAANRDEYYARPTAPAQYWNDAPHILAGRDLKERGTWMGVTVHGQVAALTNYRDPLRHCPTAVSRGHLVSNFLRSNAAPADYLQAVVGQAEQYNGFNLLVGHYRSLWYYSNRQGEIQQLQPGVYGMSNHLLNTPWPKLESGRQQLAQCLAQTDIAEEDLWSILASRQQPPDDELPATGVGLEWERRLAPAFIISPEYGTRSSTILLIDNNDQVKLIERTYHPTHSSWQEVSYKFKIKPQPL